MNTIAIRQLLSFRQGGSLEPWWPRELCCLGQFKPTPGANRFQVRGQPKFTLTPWKGPSGSAVSEVNLFIWLLYKTFHSSSFTSLRWCHCTCCVSLKCLYRVRQANCYTILRGKQTSTGFEPKNLPFCSIQPKRVVSQTIVGNVIFHYTLCKQCNPSVLSVNMIDCGLSPCKTDMREKVFFSFFPPKQSAAHRDCHRKQWLMCSHWVIPHHRLMKEESIIRAAVADVARTAIQVSGNDLLSFL